MRLCDIDVSAYDTVLLDRDGTINRQRIDDYVKDWDEFEFIPGAIEAISRFSSLAKHIFIVTNQRGIGRGLMTEVQLKEIHDNMVSVIEAAGGRIDGIFYATGIDNSDPKRKPNIGMWHDIIASYPDIRPETTIMIGDSECDMLFAENCGIDCIITDKYNPIIKL